MRPGYISLFAAVQKYNTTVPTIKKLVSKGYITHEPYYKDKQFVYGLSIKDMDNFFIYDNYVSLKTIALRIDQTYAAVFVDIKKKGLPLVRHLNRWLLKPEYAEKYINEKISKIFIINNKRYMSLHHYALSQGKQYSTILYHVKKKNIEMITIDRLNKKIRLICIDDMNLI